MNKQIKNIVKSAKATVNSENGGPSVETIILICVALIVGVALIAFGRQIATYISGAKNQVSGMEIGSVAGA